MDSFKISVEHEISKDRVSDLLCCALEGGIRYWGSVCQLIKPTGEPFLIQMNKEKRLFPHLSYPLSEGGAVIIRDDEDDAVSARLDLDAIERGLKLMAEKHPLAMAEFLTENEDADTGDTFVQLCLFGEVVYG